MRLELAHVIVMAAVRADGQTERTDKLEVKGRLELSGHLDALGQLAYDDMMRHETRLV